MNPFLRSVAIALLFDFVFGEPSPRFHPVVWMGTAIGWVERPRFGSGLARLLAGSLVTVGVVWVSWNAGRAVGSVARRISPLAGLVLEAWFLKTTLSLRALADAAYRVRSSLDEDNLGAARLELRSLVSRPTDALDRELLTSATIESVAENLADSVVAPLFYYSIGGLPAAMAYRAVNTADAMIGYHGRHEHLGKAAARLDDVLNFVPSRLSAMLIIFGASLTGGDVKTAWRTARRDSRITESPNAGWPMSAAAGALGVRLQKSGAYILGSDLPAADTAAIDHAVQILVAATAVSIPLLAVVHGASQRLASFAAGRGVWPRVEWRVR